MSFITDKEQNNTHDKAVLDKMKEIAGNRFSHNIIMNMFSTEKNRSPTLTPKTKKRKLKEENDKKINILNSLRRQPMLSRSQQMKKQRLIKEIDRRTLKMIYYDAVIYVDDELDSRGFPASSSGQEFSFGGEQISGLASSSAPNFRPAQEHFWPWSHFPRQARI